MVFNRSHYEDVLVTRIHKIIDDGMADNRIGVARLDLPDFLPPGRVADHPEAKV